MNFERWFNSVYFEPPVEWLPLMMLFATEAYTNEDSMSQYINLQGATWVRHTSKNNTQVTADVYEWPYGILIACKGTDQLSQIWDYLVKHRARNLAWDQSYVHEIGYEYFDGGREALHDFMQTRLHKPVTVVGHSMGGAIAKITGSYLRNMGALVKEVITFGAPRMESKSFIDTQKFQAFCIENVRDPIVYMPTRALPTLKGPRGSLMICWFPRKYGNMWNITWPDYRQIHPNDYGAPKHNWKVESWHGGRGSTFWRGDEPEFLLGLASLLPSIGQGLVTLNEQPSMVGSTWKDPVLSVHMSPFYLWLTSALCYMHFGIRPIGVVPGDDIFKKRHDAIYWDGITPEPTHTHTLVRVTPPPEVKPSLGESTRTQRLRRISRYMGNNAREEFIRRDLLRIRR